MYLSANLKADNPRLGTQLIPGVSFLELQVLQTDFELGFLGCLGSFPIAVGSLFLKLVEVLVLEGLSFCVCQLHHELVNLRCYVI